MNIKLNLNVRQLRDSLIDNTVKVLNKAKTKPLSPGEKLDALIKSDSTDAERITALEDIQTEINQCLN